MWWKDLEFTRYFTKINIKNITKHKSADVFGEFKTDFQLATLVLIRGKKCTLNKKMSVKLPSDSLGKQHHFCVWKTITYKF